MRCLAIVKSFACVIILIQVEVETNVKDYVIM